MRTGKGRCGRQPVRRQSWWRATPPPSGCTAQPSAGPARPLDAPLEEKAGWAGREAVGKVQVRVLAGSASCLAGSRLVLPAGAPRRKTGC